MSVGVWTSDKAMFVLAGALSGVLGFFGWLFWALRDNNGGGRFR